MAVPQGFDVPFRMFTEGCSPNVVVSNDVLDRSIRTIILTFPGERPYRPTFGSFARALIFENITEAAAIQASDEIRRALLLWEPRVTVDLIEFEVDGTTIFLTINWRANGSSQDSSTVIDFGT